MQPQAVPVTALLPCKPERAVRELPLRGPGRTPTGAAVQAELHWVSDGRWLLQMAVYGPGLPPDAYETFFGGVALRGSDG
ncbi:MAG: hypothetical protein P3W97_008455 [Tepidimonas sp.]|uniref:hypothetical protein n=1 Tax=Tepidimonas sp. TaxID=2002775 RepID=UPI00259EC525|nr:hypothetical protein [Tepidimonas sp.]MDM7457262.1 hypothetical protein [Tepidimonas sp.]